MSFWDDLLGGDFSGAVTDVGSSLSNLFGGSAADAGSALPAVGATNDAASLASQAGIFGNANPLTDFLSGTQPTPLAGGVGINSLPGSPDLPIPSTWGGATPTLDASGMPIAEGSADGAGVKGASGLWNQTKDFFGNPSTKQVAGLGLPIAGVGLAALKSAQPLPGAAALKQDAATLRGQAPGLMAPLTSGAPLPGALGQNLMASRDAQIAGIQSNFARMGLSGSSMEQASIAAANQQYAQQTFSQAQTLYNTGLSTLNQADAVNSQIISLGLQQDQELTNALAMVAGGFASGAGKSLFG